MATVTIGCRLPTGIILNLYKPFPEEVVNAVRKGELKAPPAPELIGTVELAGQNQRWKELGMLDSAILRAEDYGVTEVDESFWSAWIAANADFPALKSGAIFVAKKAADAKAIAEEMAADKSKATGFAGADKTAANIKGLES